MERNDLLTVEQAAQQLQIVKRTARRWATNGKLPIVVIAGRRFVDVSAITTPPQPLPRGRYKKS